MSACKLAWGEPTKTTTMAGTVTTTSMRVGEGGRVAQMEGPIAYKVDRDGNYLPHHLVQVDLHFHATVEDPSVRGARAMAAAAARRLAADLLALAEHLEAGG